MTFATAKQYAFDEPGDLPIGLLDPIRVGFEGRYMLVVRKPILRASRAIVICPAAVVFLALLLVIPSGSAQEPTNDGEQLPTLSIEANATAPVGTVEHEDFAGHYIRIDAGDAARDDAQLADALAFEAGIQQSRIGGFGSFSSISIRASTAAQTGIFLDGIRLNGAANAIVDLAGFALDSLSSVDVYRGAAPLQLAATNLGGAVNLTSRTQGPAQSTLKFSLGSFQTLQSHLTHHSNKNAWQTMSAIHAGSSKNNFSFINDNQTPLNAKDDRLEKRNNSNVRRLSLLSKLAYQHSESRTSDLLLQHAQRSSGVPELRNSAANEAAYDDGRGQLHLSHRVSSVARWNQKHTVFSQWSDDHYDDRLSQVGLGAQNFRSRQRVLGASTYWDKFTNLGKWAFTTEVRQEAFYSEDPLERDRPINANRRSFTGGVAYTRFSADDSWLVTPRLRFEQHNSRWAGIDDRPNANESNTVINPELGVKFNQNTRLSWTASMGRYYRVPTFSELFGTQGLLGANEELKPEQGFNAELGGQWKVQRTLNLTATLFISERDDLIAAIYDARGIGRHINIGKARITGLEWEANWQPATWWNIRANVTAQDAVNLSDIDFFYGKQLPGQAALTSYLRTTVQADTQWKLWAELSIARNQFYDRGNILPASDSSTLSIGTKWRRDDWQAQLVANNITDQNIEDFNGFPRPGRALYLGFSKRF